MIEHKIAGPYRYLNPVNDELCEFNIKFDKDRNNFEKLIEFVNMYRDKRINIECANPDVSLLSKLLQFNKNLYLNITWFNTGVSTVNKIKDAGFGVYYSSACPAYSYKILRDYIELGVSDVYIAGDLLYNLPDVRKICVENKVRMRVVVNRISNFLWGFGVGQDPRDMFFRPEDMVLLDSIFDVFELDCTNENFDTLKQIWFEDKKWPDDLRIISPDLNFYVPNQSLPPDFTKYKINCGFKCASNPNSRCRKCKQFVEIANKLAQKGIGYR